jgi:hypothetical protein
MLLVKNSDFPYTFQNNSSLLKRIVIPYKPVINLKTSESFTINKPIPFFFISSPEDKDNYVIINQKMFERHVISQDEMNMFQVLRIVQLEHFILKPSSNRSFLKYGYLLKPKNTPKSLAKWVFKELDII